MIRGETLDLEEEGLSCWSGAAREGKAFTHLCVGRAEAEQDEQAKLGGGGTEKSVTAKLFVLLCSQRSGVLVMNATD